jgi:orotate phosphoribosyltransferase
MTALEERKARLGPQIDFLRGDFTLASGKKSDFYINGKTTTLRPEALNLAARIFLELLAPAAPDRVGGMTLGADALIGAIVALSHDAGTPYEGFIVRKEAKGHGTGQWIEGPELRAGQRVAILEDVVTTGGSALASVERVRAAQPECEVVGVWALVDRLDGGREALEAADLPLTSIFTKDELFALGQTPEEA